MQSKNVAQFATELKMPADLLLKQLHAAGIDKRSTSDHLSKQDKDKLLAHLRQMHGVSPDSERKKITLTRKDNNNLSSSGNAGKSRSIQVEVRKKNTFIQRPEQEKKGLQNPKTTASPIIGEAANPTINSSLAEENANAQSNKTNINEDLPSINNITDIKLKDPDNSLINEFQQEESVEPNIYAIESNKIEKSFIAEISSSDKHYETTKSLLNDGYAGVILTGPPGTSKSWYAKQIAALLVDEISDRVRTIQFHPAYQYEDFIEGYTPNADGGFELQNKVFLEICRVARNDYPGKTCVLIIDELSRCDVARVFGEALTYLEMGKRNIPFRLASGNEIFIPENLVIIATMNPWDRGVDELDAALERRFAKLTLDPDSELLETILSKNNVEAEIKTSLHKFFNLFKNHSNHQARIGHAYFDKVKGASSLSRLWDHQLKYHFERVFRLDAPSLESVSKQWQQLMQSIQK